ncbi:YbaN family protein [Epibacterium sp. MM17-32]|uniref:YbaN family protein n=1 Tax=Epibacterium sp. MM17-32 TaxID=2917734 RepID=UPI001EF56F8A|nr:YbaN family protein [Epibacterium sp. MM17-32]MCG7628291.1 YbaN family protein [Epibacterium sp. MM17-32]
MKIIYLCLGLFCVLMAMVGIALPLLPTVPFLLLAAFFFARSSDRLHDWLLSHATFGPMISDWNEHGAIRIGAKKAATVSVAAVLLLSIFLQLPGHILLIQAVTLAAVMIFIWTRPNG